MDDAVIPAADVVVATSLGPAQRLLAPAVGGDPWFADLLAAATTPSVTVQIELDRPVTPVDRTTFGPGTALASFSEQSRTTFPRADGRLSVILQPPEPYLHAPDNALLALVLAELRRLDLPIDGTVRRHRVVRHADDFLSLEPGHAHRRPPQSTPTPGLHLAGDWTRQPFLSTMEGAVRSGHAAARSVQTARSQPLAHTAA
jgi:15-cis-phytoene desaturase